jgi:hypothetical protein
MKKQLLSLAVLGMAAIVGCSKKTESGPTSTFVLNQNDLQGDIKDGTVVLKSGLTYLLAGPLNVKDGATLTIEEGVTLIAQTDKGASNLFISVERGGKLNVSGSATKPVIFTSTGTDRGSWGGIAIHGKAPNNVGINAASEINGVQYGGADATDNSGTIRYAIIRNSGAKNGDKEWNGISFFSVGSGTVCEYVAIFNGNDDAFEWYGGTNNCSYLYAENNDDDNFDYDLGYSGTLTNLYSINSNTNASSDSRGMECDGNPDNNLASPFTNPTVSNVTLIGRGSTVTTQREGIYLRRGVKGTITNVYMKGFSVGVGVEHSATIAAVGSPLKVNNITFSDVVTKTKGKDGTTAPDVSAVITEGTSTGAGNGADKPTWANWF